MRKTSSASFPVTAAVASLSFFPGGNVNAGGAAVWLASGRIEKIAVPYDIAASIEMFVHVFDGRKADGSPMDSGGQRHLVTVGTLAALNGDFEAYGRAITGTLDGTNRLFTAGVPSVAVGFAGATIPQVEIDVGVDCPTGMIVQFVTPAGIGAGRFFTVTYTPNVLGGTRRQWAAKNYQYIV